VGVGVGVGVGVVGIKSNKLSWICSMKILDFVG